MPAGFIDCTDAVRDMAPFDRLAALTNNTFSAYYRVDPRGDRALIRWDAYVQGYATNGEIEVYRPGATNVQLTQAFADALSNLATSAYENVRMASKRLGGSSW